MIRFRKLPLVILFVGSVMLLSVAAAAVLRPVAGEAMTRWANAWLSTLDENQKAQAKIEFADAKRVGWHFIPKAERKGVQLKEMNPVQKTAALRLLRSALSEAGFDKSVRIMELESILNLQEGAKAKFLRDPERYFFSVFGEPSTEGTWGLSIEGHHLSLNFTMRDGKVVDSTPQFMGSNPAEVKTKFPNLLNVGVRVLRDEEQLGFDLLHLLAESPDALKKTMIAEKAPEEIRAAGEPQPPVEEPQGIEYSKLGAAGQLLLRRLVETYCNSMPEEVANERLRNIEESGWEHVYFAWAGANQQGSGHYYRIQGTTFLIEFINVQPDAEGNIANHIHCVWRDLTGDFDLPAA